jgi:hypothetical protein
MHLFVVSKFHFEPCGSDHHVALSADRIEGTICIEPMSKESTGVIGHFLPLSEGRILGLPRIYL